MNDPFTKSQRRAGLQRFAIALALVGASLLGVQAHASPGPQPDDIHANVPAAPHANFAGETVSSDAREIVEWVIRTRNNQGLPFVIVDKKSTKVFMFDGHANLVGATPALLGLARGDVSAPGVGDKRLADIAPSDRITQAGRFVASLGVNLANQDILWVDYQTALALHRVLSANSNEHRLERLGTNSSLDRRITFGCINVPTKFYTDVVRPQFVGTTGIVYILPETKSLAEVFFQQTNG